jgi:hypothetical protein
VRPVLVTRDGAADGAGVAARLEGRVLAHDVRGARGEAIVRKGRVLDRDDVERLLDVPWRELHLVEMDAGDLHEDAAGLRLATAAAGDGVEVRAQAAGHWPLAATRRGILGVAADALRRVNAVEGMCVYTLYDGQVVDAGEAVARAKIIPFVVHEARVREAETVARDAGALVRVRAFRPMRVGAVVQETLGERAATRFREALREKIAWFGSTLLEPCFVRPDAREVADALDALANRADAEIVLVAGAKALDPLDPAFRALERLGVPLERFGVPAHPGSLLWIARVRQVSIVGMPSCGLFSQATVFDLVLPRLLTGEPVGRSDLAELGHGGFLTREMSFRFPPYRESSKRGEVGGEASV